MIVVDCDVLVFVGGIRFEIEEVVFYAVGHVLVYPTFQAWQFWSEDVASQIFEGKGVQVVDTCLCHFYLECIFGLAVAADRDTSIFFLVVADAVSLRGEALVHIFFFRSDAVDDVHVLLHLRLPWLGYYPRRLPLFHLILAAIAIAYIGLVPVSLRPWHWHRQDIAKFAPLVQNLMHFGHSLVLGASNVIIDA